jgi:hypothetical protein
MCLGKRLQRLGNRMALDLWNFVEGLCIPQSRLHVGYKVFTAQVNLVPKTIPDAGMSLTVVNKLCMSGTRFFSGTSKLTQ